MSSIEKRKRSYKRILQFTLPGCAVILILISLRFVLKPSVKKADIQIASVKTDNIEASVTASGIVYPEFEEIKTSPVQSRIIAIYRSTGDKVRNGDSILSLDRRSVESSYEKMNDELNLKKNNINQLRLAIEMSLIDKKTQVKIKELQVENLKTELDEENYLNSIGGGTKDRIEKAMLNLRIAQLELEQINQSILNEEKSMNADLLSLNYEISIQQKNVDDLREKLKLSTIIADKEGVITWIDDQIGKNVNIGDELVKIANLQSYGVNGSITEMHAEKLYVGGQVTVRLNEDTDLKGEIVNISPSISGNIIHFRIKLCDKSNSSLRPNLKVDVFVVTAYKRNVLLVSNGPFYKGGVKQKVFVIQDNELVCREVDFGESNIDHVEITGGLKKDEQIVLSDMTDYDEHKRVKLR